MISSHINIKVRYSEVDKMNIVYYSRYLEYFEVARSHWLDEHICAYHKIEENFKIGLPVVECNIKYIKPAKYNDELTINCAVNIDSNSKILEFIYAIYQGELLLVNGFTKHLFYDIDNSKVVPFPDSLLKLINASID